MCRASISPLSNGLLQRPQRSTGAIMSDIVGAARDVGVGQCLFNLNRSFRFSRGGGKVQLEGSTMSGGHLSASFLRTGHFEMPSLRGGVVWGCVVVSPLTLLRDYCT